MDRRDRYKDQRWSQPGSGPSTRSTLSDSSSDEYEFRSHPAVRPRELRRIQKPAQPRIDKPMPSNALPGLTKEVSSPLSDSSPPSSPDLATNSFQSLAKPLATWRLPNEQIPVRTKSAQTKWNTDRVSIENRRGSAGGEDGSGHRNRLRRKKSQRTIARSKQDSPRESSSRVASAQPSQEFRSTTRKPEQLQDGSTKASPGFCDNSVPSDGDDALDENFDQRVVPVFSPSKMLHLMRVTKGRMHGDLFHREKDGDLWVVRRCFVHSESGSLRAEAPGGSNGYIELFPDLRGCIVRALFDSLSGAGFLEILSRDGAARLHVRPRSESYFNAWFAALLCWRPVRVGQRIQSRATQLQPIPANLPAGDVTATAASKSFDKHAVIKVGRAVLVEPDETIPGSILPSVGKTRQPTGKHVLKTRWLKVSCTLRAGGELHLFGADDSSPLVSVQLAELPRSAVQRLHSSVLEADCVVAIFPQYSKSSETCSRVRPIYLSYDSRESFEVWFVLLRALATPELYGANRGNLPRATDPSEILPGIDPQSTLDLFRYERNLQIRIDEASFVFQNIRKFSAGDQKISHRRASMVHATPENYYVEILLDGKLRAKTSVKMRTIKPYWFETFDFTDCGGSALSSMTVRVKKQSLERPTFESFREQVIADGDDGSCQRDEDSPSFKDNDVVCGEAFFDANDLVRDGLDENPHALLDESGWPVGEVSFKLKHRQDNILMEREYDQLSDVLHNFSNGLTIQIAQRLPSELAKLAECLLNVFQVSGQAGQWLMLLAEAEIDGARELPNVGRLRYTKRAGSNESRSSHALMDREEFVRDFGKHATAEVNLLFRGNTLLSKALDYYMRRVGQKYLEETLGPRIRELAVDETGCEVDPTRLTPEDDVQRNWQRLISLTKDIWEHIYRSASNCPPELRMIFRHIRACVQDRYGDIMRSVTYSSVSGFLFLRFFCAAVLNPQLFGLISGLPRPPAQRTFVLLAKSLQGLANMTTFGNKEPWMSRMNGFLNAHRKEFKDFIEDTCAVPADYQLQATASYSTPLAVFQRLPLKSREGYLSLPHLIDRSRSLAGIVNIWLDHVRTPDSNEPPSSNSGLPITGDLARFHALCVGIRKTTQTSLASVDRAERPINPFSHKWVNIAEHMEAAPSNYWMRRRRGTSPRRSSVSRASQETSESARRRARSYPVASASMLQGNASLRPSRPSESRSRSVSPMGSTERVGRTRPSDEASAFETVTGGKDRHLRGIFSRRNRSGKRVATE